VPEQLYGLTLDVATTTAPGTLLGRRPRGAEDAHDNMGLCNNDDYRLHPRKKGKGKMVVSGVPEAAKTTSKAATSLPPGTLQKDIIIPRWRDAERGGSQADWERTTFDMLKC
jgi:hypothetical protein